jgi:serine/threonine-protein kinase
VAEITARLSTALADRYKLERHLGEGGMATVYLAHDLKHDRKVAVKVLRPELAAVLGHERFIQEIKTTANLQHPHILPLFDSGEAGGFLYYVMPYIEGETLRDKLDHDTQLGIEEAVRITTDVADALDYAHRHNVIHRDIKPENILLQDGRPIVADFGIALAVSAAAGGRMTETGLSLGTPHYMSPEQATAEKELTNRSDVYSLGCVLYEMLTGSPPHVGSSAQQIIMKIVTEEARPVTDLRKLVPPHVAATTAKALERLPADRFESAAKFTEALTNPAFTLPTTQAMPTGAVPQPWRRNALSLGMTAAAVALLGTTLWGWLRPIARPVTRQEVVLWPSGWDVPALAIRHGTAVAPDGSGLVYHDSVGEGTQLVFKPRDQAEAIPISGTEGGLGPFFSPDGAWLGFMADGNLRKVPVGGGASITLADSAAANLASGAWLDDGTIVYLTPSWNLNRVSDAGGEPATLVEGSGFDRYIMDVAPLPGARGVLLSGCSSQCQDSEVYVYDLRADTVRMLFEEARGVWYVPTGHVLFAGRAGGVFAAQFDLRKLEVSGPAIPVLEGVVSSNLQVSVSGTVLYRVGGADLSPLGLAELVWVDRQGRATQVDPAWRFDAGTSNRGLALSPDEMRVAVRARVDGNYDIWVKELPRGPLSRLTFDEGPDRKPVWMPDGESVMFITPRGGGGGDWDVWVRRADGTGEAQLLVDNEGFIAWAAPTPDGEWIVLRTGGASGIEGGRDILTYRPGVDSAPVPLLAGAFDEWGPAVSPDARWIAYASTETGTTEVFLRPFPDVESGRWQVSTAGGRMPTWSNSGRELFFLSDAQDWITAEIQTVPTVRILERRVLFAVGDEYATGAGGGHVSVTADDQRFLMMRHVSDGAAEEAEAPRYILVYNWFEELREKVGR